MVQNFCIRFAVESPYRAHITPYLKEVRWLNMKGRRWVHLCCLIYNVVKRGIPNYLSSKIEKRSEAHNLNLRNSNDLLSVPIHCWRTSCSRPPILHKKSNNSPKYHSLPIFSTLKFINMHTNDNAPLLTQIWLNRKPMMSPSTYGTSHRIYETLLGGRSLGKTPGSVLSEKGFN